MLQSYRLLRIIIIDSFWKGQVNELDLSGHTQLEGTNGAGKTSLMRLLPLFYGMRPGEIVSKVDQAKNFADYYLPRQSSMLVYEYQRPNAQTCMAIATSDGRGVHFKLIEGHYQPALFIGGQGTPFTATEVERHYRNHGSFCSPYLGVDKYRQVIQNLASGKKLKEIRQLQQRFSLSARPCPHIDKVINGTIEKNLDFDLVKKMLIAISSDYLARNPMEEREQIGLNREEINRWLADLRASRWTGTKTSAIEQWKAEFATLEELLSKLQQLYAELGLHQEQLSGQQQELEQSRRQQRDERQQLELELEQKNTELQNRINELTAIIEADEARIAQLDRDKAKFDEDDAASYEIRAAREPQILQQLKEINSIISSFEGDLSKIAEKFEKLLSELKLQEATGEQEYQKKISEIREQAAEKLDAIQQQHMEQEQQLNQHLTAQLIALKESEQLLTSEKRILEHQQSNPALDPELIEAVEQNRQNLSTLKSEQTQALKLLNQLDKTHAALDKERQQLLNRHLQAERYVEELNRRYRQAEQQLLPEAHSLHHFLENEGKEWKNTIGCLLTPELLSRTDLSPQWLDSNETLYGLALDLGPLAQNNPLLLSETELREHLQQAETLWLQQKELVAQIEQQLHDLQRKLKESDSAISAQKQQLQRLNLNEEQLTREQEKLNLKKQKQLKAVEQESKNAIAAIDEKLRQHRQQLNQFEEQSREQRHELNNQKLEKRVVIESDRDLQLDELQSQRQQWRDELKERRRDYQLQRKTAMDKLDPDGEIDKRLWERKQLEKSLEECAELAQKARVYKQFMSERYQQRDKLANQCQQRQLGRQELASAQQKFNQTQQNAINKLKQGIARLSSQLQTNEDLLTQLLQCQKLCDASAIAPQSEPQQQFECELAITLCNDWLNQFNALHKSLSQALNQFHQLLRQQHGSSQLFENWQQLIQNNDHYQGASEIMRFRSALNDLQSSAEQLQKITGQSIAVNANMINEFYQHIENFGRRISTIGRNLSKCVTELARFEALAEFSVNTVMKQEELEFWGPLQRFARLFEKEREALREGNGEIPEALIEEMRTLAKYLPTEGLLLEHHQLFDIEFTITEKGQIKHARNARQLKKVSSTGLSYLAMLSLFAGILVMLRGKDEQESATQIILPVDELGELAAENVDLLLQMFNRNHIRILSASPSSDRHILALYDKHYKLKDNRIYHAAIPASRLDQLLAIGRAQKEANHAV